MSDELYALCAYVNASKYRKEVIGQLYNRRPITPTVLAQLCDIRTNHISNTLHELKDKELIVCLNEEMRKGRLYRLTEKGEDVFNILHDLSDINCEVSNEIEVIVSKIEEILHHVGIKNYLEYDDDRILIKFYYE